MHGLLVWALIGGEHGVPSEPSPAAAALNWPELAGDTSGDG